MAASSFDDVIAISLFGVVLGIAFSEGSCIKTVPLILQSKKRSLIYERVIFQAALL